MFSEDINDCMVQATSIYDTHSMLMVLYSCFSTFELEKFLDENQNCRLKYVEHIEHLFMNNFIVTGNLVLGNLLFFFDISAQTKLSIRLLEAKCANKSMWKLFKVQKILLRFKFSLVPDFL